jgi:hypothetical protein
MMRPMTPPVASHKASYCLLMTSCIAPKAGVRRIDPGLRLADYRAALKFWFEKRDPRITGIVFSDNSGYPLSELRDYADTINIHRLPIEFHEFDHPAATPYLNYGYNEFILINATLARSTLTSLHSHFIKTTGRYRFPAISRLLDNLPAHFDLAVDCRGCDLPCIRIPRQASIALFVCRLDFYLSDLADIPNRMVPAPPWNRLQYAEDVLYDRFYPRRNEPGLILRWPCSCDPAGIGANGINHTSPHKRLHNFVRAVARRLLPSCWI